jgi:hypothetical protein
MCVDCVGNLGPPGPETMGRQTRSVSGELLVKRSTATPTYTSSTLLSVNLLPSSHQFSRIGVSQQPLASLGSQCCRLLLIHVGIIPILDCWYFEIGA